MHQHETIRATAQPDVVYGGTKSQERRSLGLVQLVGHTHNLHPGDQGFASIVNNRSSLKHNQVVLNYMNMNNIT